MGKEISTTPGSRIRKNSGLCAWSNSPKFCNFGYKDNSTLRRSIRLTGTRILAMCLVIVAFSSMTAHAQAPGNSAVSPKEEIHISKPYEVRLEVMQKLKVTAKREGFLETASMVPGTIIEKGQVIAVLDVRHEKLKEKQLLSEIKALQEEASNTSEIEKAKEELKVAKLRNTELGMAALQTSIPRLELMEAATKLNTGRAAISDAASKHRQAKYKLAAKEAELEMVQLDIQQSTIVAPFDGIVFKQLKHVGEAVSPSEPIAEIYRLDYLLGTVLLLQKDIPPQQLQSLSGKIVVRSPSDEELQFAFEAPSAIPRLERDGRFFAVVKVKNRKRGQNNTWALLPGMRANLITNKPQIARE